MMTPSDRQVSRMLWAELGGASQVEDVTFSGPPNALPSKFQAGVLASASIAVAALAAAEHWAARRSEPVRAVLIDRALSAAAFRCERLITGDGWTIPALWDAIAGDYKAANGWIRLHTNYASHRDAVTRVLEIRPEKEQVAKAVASWSADELESAVIEAGGCAAAVRTMAAWHQHPQGVAIAAEPIFAWQGRCARRPEHAVPTAPLSGIRVLDLTRVIAGPVATRCLAGYGAQVLRVDPPGFQEVPALLPEMTRGKRCAALDLKRHVDRAIWEELVGEADVLVHGYRPGAMEALGYPIERLHALNPRLVIARYDAYGWTGPWAARRGFDSLVQMSTGIAHPGDAGPPQPLPAQCLDHGMGYLLAAAICRALTDGRSSVRLSLARTAKLLVDLGLAGDPSTPALADADALLERSETAWGPVKHVRFPGTIDGYTATWHHPAGPLGRDEPCWRA